MKIAKSKGFTLIELLVVITLIGILAVAVLSAINPIEQINKARDAGRRADAAQILKSLDRYFASTEEFPWNNTSWSDSVTPISAEFLGRASMNGVGICGGDVDVPASGAHVTEATGANGCLYDGLLIATEELKGQFTKRKAFRTNPAAEDKFYLVKIANDPSVSVCFVPSSKATRSKWEAETGQLKSLALTGDLPTTVQDCTIQFPSSEPTWLDNATSCYVCIPEE